MSFYYTIGTRICKATFIILYCVAKMLTTYVTANLPRDVRVVCLELEGAELNEAVAE